MTLYVAVFLILGLLAFLESEKIISSKRVKRTVVYVFFGVFFVLTALRWGGPGDFNEYRVFFEELNAGNFAESKFEIGYTVLAFLVKSITSNYSVFLAVGGALICICHIAVFERLYFSKKNSVLKKPVAGNQQKRKSYIKTHSKDLEDDGNPLFVLLIFWALHFSYIFFIRSNLAYSICFFSIIFIKEKKPLKFIITVILASTFHVSALIFLPAYILYHFKISGKARIILTILLSLVFIAVFEPAALFVAKFLGEDIYNSVVYYVGNSNQFGSVYSTLFNLAKGLANIVFLLLFYQLSLQKHKDDKLFNGLFNIFCIGCIIYSGIMLSSPAMTRMIALYLDVQLIITAKALDAYKKGTKRIVFLLLVAYLLLRHLVALNTYETDGYFPFPSIFTNKV